MKNLFLALFIALLVPSGLYAQTSLALPASGVPASGITGVVALANGGTGAATFGANCVLGNFTGSTAALTCTAAPTFSAANLTSFPTFNQNTTGTAANVSGTPALPNGTTATTQSANSADSKLATDNTVINAFATPPTAGYGSTTPEPVAATTLTATSLNNVVTPLHLTGKTANISTTAIFTPAASHYYLVCANATITTAGTTSTFVTPLVSYYNVTDGVQKFELIGTGQPASTANTTGVANGGCVNIYAGTGGAVSYSTTGYGSTGTAMTYDLIVTVTLLN